ncbi:MAG: heavy-metal-associated domain-containing protein [Planctomycetales bacterium]
MAAFGLRLTFALALAALLFPSSAVAKKTAATYTTISVHNMHCGACAKKIAAKLYLVSGVLEVRADVKKNHAYVVPQKRATPSPRAMWEAVEKAGFKPVNISGPAGRFTKKPKN